MAPPGQLMPNGASAALPVLPGWPRYSLDRVGSVTEPYAKQPVAIPLDGNLEVAGFGFDEPANTPAAGVDLVVDGLPFTAHYGSDREDVAQYFKNPELAKTGFQFSAAARLFGSGKHIMAVRLISADKKTYQEGPPLSVEIR
jgi:hypothetical protein